MDYILYRISKARKDNQMNQRDLAVKLGVTKQTVSNWETGKVPLDLRRLQQIAEVLQKPIDYFLVTKQNEQN